MLDVEVVAINDIHSPYQHEGTCSTVCVAPRLRLGRLLQEIEPSKAEREQLTKLVYLFAELPPPPDPLGIFARYTELKLRFLTAMDGTDAIALEKSFLDLYTHLHGYEVPYTPRERRHLVRAKGHLCHVGGLSPIFKAAPFISEQTFSADFGACNGLQGLLLQFLYPHQKTTQVEISSRMVALGKQLQGWLAIPEERVQWVVGDIGNVSPANLDFIYLYRPVRPTARGKRFYEHFACQLATSRRRVVIFSVADCLRRFLPPQFEVFYHDGHLTCFRKTTL